MTHRYHGESNQINVRKEDKPQNEKAIKAESKTRTSSWSQSKFIEQKNSLKNEEYYRMPGFTYPAQDSTTGDGSFMILIK